MNREMFYKEVKDNILSFMPEEFSDHTVRIDEVMKGGGVSLHGMSLFKGNNGTSPILYLEPFYDLIGEGWSMDKIMSAAAEKYTEYVKSAPKLSLPDLSYNKVHKNLGVKVLYNKTNDALLNNLVSHDVGCGYSLAVYIDLSGKVFDGAIINVRKDMLETIGCDENKLMSEAIKSSEARCPARLTYISDELFAQFGCSPEDLLSGETTYDKDKGFLVLSTTDRYAGAAALFYPEVQKRIAEIVQSSYYVIPSSIHEVLILPDNGDHKARELAEMVKMVNENEVAPEERLGNRVLYFDAAAMQLAVACDLDKVKEKDMEFER